MVQEKSRGEGQIVALLWDYFEVSLFLQYACPCSSSLSRYLSAFDRIIVGGSNQTATWTDAVNAPPLLGFLRNTNHLSCKTNAVVVVVT